MRTFLIFLFLFASYNLFASEIKSKEIKNISDDKTRTIDNLYHSETEDILKIYQKDKEKFEKSKAFKILDFLYQKKEHGIDIDFKEDNKIYFMPMLFAFSSTKRSLGLGFESGNILKKGEQAKISLDTSKEGFSFNGQINFDKNSFTLQYTRLKFDQRFYEDGWTSLPGEFIAAQDQNNYDDELLEEVKTKREKVSFIYTRKISNLWSVYIKPEYEYYNYQNLLLDSKNHSHITFGLSYTDDVSRGTNIGTLTKIKRLHKETILKNLPKTQIGKLADLAYTNGGTWTGSDYEIQKITLSGAYLLEFKNHNSFAFFAKGEKAFKAPFSNLVRSYDMLFGLGIYDREQRGKAGVSFGFSFTYFLVKSQTGILNFSPFYEQAFIENQNNNFTVHNGIGVILGAQLWAIPLPVSLNFTRNLEDSSQHFGIKIGAHF